MIEKEYTSDVEIRDDNVLAKTKILNVNDAFELSNLTGASLSSDAIKSGLNTSSFAEVCIVSTLIKSAQFYQ